MLLETNQNTAKLKLSTRVCRMDSSQALEVCVGR